MSLTEAIILASLTSVFPWIMFLFRHLAFTRAFLAGMRLRCAYSGLIFRKVRNRSSINRKNESVFIHIDYKIIDRIIRNTFKWKTCQYVNK